MGRTFSNLCNSCTNIGCEFQSGIVRTKCAFYMPPQLEPDNCGNYVVQDSTTKNDIRDNRVKNELNRVKDELEPTTKKCESCRYYGSHHEVCNYCYKCSLWTEQEPTTKNDLGDDCVRRKAVLNTLERMDKVLDEDRTVDSYKELLKECYKVLPSVTPQESILDKIRAEMLEEILSHSGTGEEVIQAYADGLKKGLEILDKCKAESEVGDGNDD